MIVLAVFEKNFASHPCHGARDGLRFASSLSSTELGATQRGRGRNGAVVKSAGFFGRC